MNAFKKVNFNFEFKPVFENQKRLFGFKQIQEQLFLEDINNFIKNKCQIEKQYLTSSIELCQENLNKSYRNLDEHDIIRTMPIPEEWKQALEKMICLFEKRLANNMNLMLLCDYFSIIKKQKDASFNKVLENLSQFQGLITRAHNVSKESFKRYCFEEFLDEKLNSKKFNSKQFNEKLKLNSIKSEAIGKIYNHIDKKSNDYSRMRYRQVDITKLNYILMNRSLNQILQFYYSNYLPELKQIQSCKIKTFVCECINSIQEIECANSSFVLNFYNENLEKPSEVQQKIYKLEEEILMLDNAADFNQLIQFDLESPNSLVEDYTNHINDEKSVKYFTHDYEFWMDKTNYLRSELKKLTEELNDNVKPSLDLLKINYGNDPWASKFYSKCIVNEDKEDLSYYILKKKLELVELSSKLETLETFNICKELEEKNSDLFTYSQISLLNGDLDCLITGECSFYVESMIRTISKPFINPDDLDIINESW